MVAATPSAPLSTNKKDLTQQLTGVRSGSGQIPESLQGVKPRACLRCQWVWVRHGYTCLALTHWQHKHH